MAETASSRPVLVIRPRGRFSAVDARELWAYRDLGLVFAGRDIRLRYRQTALGVLWVVLQPLLAALVFTFVFGHVAHLKSDGVDYLPFAFAGLLSWNAFSNVVTRSSTALTAAQGMVSKVYFPRLLLPLSTLGSTLLDFTVGFAVQLVLLVIYGINPGWHVVFLPIWLVVTVALATGVGLVASSLVVRFRDVQYVLPILTQLLLFASPVAYSLNVIPADDRSFATINPLTGMLEAFRWSLLGRGALSGAEVSYSAIAAVVAVTVGAFVFSSLERDFADVI